MGPRDLKHDSGKHLTPEWHACKVRPLDVSRLYKQRKQASSHACHRSVTHATELPLESRVKETHGISRFKARLWETSDAGVACVQSPSPRCVAPLQTKETGIFSRMPQICDASLKFMRRLEPRDLMHASLKHLTPL